MPLGQLGGPGLGPFARLFNDPIEMFTKLGTLISNIIGVLTVVAALWFLTQLVTAGFAWISAGGDKNKLAEAQHKITNAIVGLLIVVVAVVFLDLITRLLGFESFLRPSALIEQLRPPKI